MKYISQDHRILSIAHNDWDGAFSQIVLGNVFKNIKFIDTSFYKIDSILESLDYSEYDYVFLTDIHPDSQNNLYLSEKIILIDHHESAIEYNDPSKMHYVIPGKCGSLLTLNFVEKYFKIELTHLHEHCTLVNDYDMWILDDPRSKKLNDLMFFKYRPKKFRELFFDGRVDFTEEENLWLEQRKKKFEDLYDSLEVFEFEKLPGCIVQTREFINEICQKLMEEENYNIIFVRNPSTNRVSVRHNLDNLHAGNILKAHGWGGGHAQSAGFFTNDFFDFQEKVKILEKDMNEKLGD
jgi:oligoribonuclease NrnB/cAMP/cGMP phosphodiesterase (DHH superfamily)